MNDSRTVRLIITCIFTIGFTAILEVGVLSWRHTIEVGVLVALVGLGGTSLGGLAAMLAQTNSKPKPDETITQMTTASSASPADGAKV